MRRTVVLVAVVVAVCAGRGWAQDAPASPAPGEGYVWAEACKSCHEPIYEAWSKTKHAKAIDRLGRDERQAGSTCVGCHITGSKDPIEVDGKVVNLNVQCESCHGPGKAHIEAAQAGNVATARMVKSPPEKSCTPCHSDKSPHYRGFFYAALKGLVHKK